MKITCVCAVLEAETATAGDIARCEHPSTHAKRISKERMHRREAAWGVVFLPRAGCFEGVGRGAFSYEWGVRRGHMRSFVLQHCE